MTILACIVIWLAFTLFCGVLFSAFDGLEGFASGCFCGGVFIPGLAGFMVATMWAINRLAG